MTLRFVPTAIAFLAAAASSHAQFTSASSFTIGSQGVSLGVDPVTGEVWTYSSFGATIARYSAAGALLGSVPRPGESANDVDIEFTTAALTLGTTAIPAGTLLFINGESGVAEVYAVNPANGSLLATLATQFGVSHVVGGAQHTSRGTLFLVQDRVPGGTAANRVAEINPQTGAVIQTFQITATRPSFTVNFGDIEVGGNGNLFIASEDELTIAEFTPTGVFVVEHTLPAGVDALSGIGINPADCSLWAMETSGTVWKLLPGSPTHPICDPACPADVDDGSGTGTPDGGVTIDDLIYYLGLFEAGDIDADVDDGSGTGTLDGGVTIDDLIYFLTRFEAGC